MKGRLQNEFGSVTIDSDVIATYAGSVAVESFGIVGMAAVNVKDGLVKLLKRDYLSHGINVTIDDDNMITIVNSSVKYKIEEFTGLKIKKINVSVEGVRVID